MKNRCIIVAGMFVTFFLFGCASRPNPTGPRADLKLVQPTPHAIGRTEELSAFQLCGIYRIIDFERFGAAESLSPPALTDGFTFGDGGVAIKLTPVPYGVRLSLRNKLYESLMVDGARCTLIDEDGQSYPIELRHPTMLYPPRDPWSQTLTIAPCSSCDICFDAISAVKRSQINAMARSDCERGAFMAVDAPLPVFCSGYFLYPSDQPNVDRIRRWAFGRTFGVYVELRGASGSYYGYRLRFTPFRFASGPDSDAWEDKKLTPIAGE